MSKERSIKVLSADLMEKILSHSTDPGECGQFITLQIRELIGVKMVALYEVPIMEESENYQLISVCPPRHKEKLKDPFVSNLCRKAREANDTIEIFGDDENLQALNLGTSFIIPLNSGGEHVGVLLLLDLLSVEGVEAVLETLKNISGIIGLIFKNSNLYRHLDQLVQKRTSQLESLQEYFKNIIDSMPSILITVDQEGKIVQWNETAEKMLIGNNLFGKGDSIEVVFPQLQITQIEILESLASKESSQKKIYITDDEMKKQYLNITIYPLTSNETQGAVIRIDDITDQTKLEEMMLQNDKMLSVGSLAAGMGHEINNPLAGIIHSLSVLTNRLYDNINMSGNQDAAKIAGLDLEAMKTFMEIRDIPNILHMMNISGARIATLVENLLTFTQQDNDSAETFDIQELIEKTIELVETDYDLKKLYGLDKIRIVTNFSNQIPKIRCNGPQIQHVLFNIIQNSVHALHSDKEETPRITIDLEYYAVSHLVIIKISDNGPGIPEEIQHRVFEPFFTTSEPGKGTGLGLSIAYFIITEQHQGRLEVDSKEGEGTRFTIRLPI